MSEDFNTPALPDTGANVTAANETLPNAAAPIVADNSGKTDELSVAVEKERMSNAVFIAEEVAKPVKYALEYVLDGVKYIEKHATVEHALASVRRLRVLGIVPATSTL